MADYLAGYVASSSFTQGVLRRDMYQNTFSLFAQDQFQVLPSLTLNYGLRYDYNAPLSSPGVVSDFCPGTTGADNFGLVLDGTSGLGSIYPANKSNLAPRFGFAYNPAQKLVIRGIYGIFFDAINFNGFFDNRPGNGGAVGVQANPTGAKPVLNVSPSFYQWKTGVDPFTTGAGGPTVFGLATISPSFRTAYIQNFNLNMKYQVSQNTILQVGYVGALARRLFDLIDINQARPGAGSTATHCNHGGRTTAAALFPTRRPLQRSTRWRAKELQITTRRR